MNEKWEYNTISAEQRMDLEQSLNKAGGEGWQAVSMTIAPNSRFWVLLKRLKAN